MIGHVIGGVWWEFYLISLKINGILLTLYRERCYMRCFAVHLRFIPETRIRCLTTDWKFLVILMYKLYFFIQKQIPMKPYLTPEASSILQGLLCLDVDNNI